MLRNYLKVAVRYLLHHKGYTAINVLGLAVGVASCILIMLFVKSEMSYDRFHSKADRIYRAWVNEDWGEDQVFTNSITAVPLAPTIEENFPEVEMTSRVYNFNTAVSVSADKFNESIHMVDTTFFDMFDYPLAEGNRAKAFPSKSSVIITKEVAKKYFGNENPMGKTLQLDFNEEPLPFTVAGVVDDYPNETSIRFGILIPFANLYNTFPERINRQWFNVSVESYILLREGVSADALAAKFPAMMEQQLGEEANEVDYQINLQPLTAIHLDNTVPAGIQPTSNPMYSYVLSVIGILILLVACINFVTLSIGRSTSRNLEVGIRKVLGAERMQLIRQFWGEAFLLTVVSVLVGVGLSLLLLEPYNQLVNRELSIGFTPFFVLFCLGIMLVIGFIAGIYPALVLSGFNPVDILKGKIALGSNIGIFRKSLVVGQFVVSVGMIIITIIVSQQLDYLRNKNLGYQQDQTIIVQTNKSGEEGTRLAELYKQELQQQPQVESAATSLFSFQEPGWVSIGYTDDNGQYRNLSMNQIDADFIPAMGIRIKEGRNFSDENPADLANAIIVNEALVREYGWENPIGQKLPGGFEQRVIGVVEDFHYQSLHSPIEPLVMSLGLREILQHAGDVGFVAAPQQRVTVRLSGGQLSENVATLQQAWEKVAPNQDFDFQFLDESLAQRYEEESRLGSIVQIASLLAIFIACMGLFGLATLAVARRTKEIGIRKVLGASVPDVVRLIAKDFVVMVVVAIVIATPLAWWAMNYWLEDFAYRIDIRWWVFAIAGVVALIIAVATVSWQAVRAAIANPVDAIKTE